MNKTTKEVINKDLLEQKKAILDLVAKGYLPKGDWEKIAEQKQSVKFWREHFVVTTIVHEELLREYWALKEKIKKSEKK